MPVKQVVVAGHICLDMIPAMQGTHTSLQDQLVPGKLINIGAATVSTGGAVSNTGLALHRLGVATRLMGKIGGDTFGQAILGLLSEYGHELADGMIVVEGDASSYTVVISPPGTDRLFLHCTGANDTFGPEDIRDEELRGAELFHFGYPPLMRRMYSNHGVELASLLERVKRIGLTTSLDMARPDPDSDAGRVDWLRILARSLPEVDVFLPSVEELLYMTDREQYDRMAVKYGADKLLEHIDEQLVRELAERMLGMGTAIVVIKLGEFGLYVRTTSSRARLVAMGAVSHGLPLDRWVDRELYIPCFEADVAGTTGAGDCTIAGFLAGMLRGMTIEDTLVAAVAVGACNVERTDAISGIPDWNTVQRRVHAGWRQRSRCLELDSSWQVQGLVRTGPGDMTRKE